MSSGSAKEIKPFRTTHLIAFLRWPFCGQVRPTLLIAAAVLIYMSAKAVDSHFDPTGPLLWRIVPSAVIFAVFIGACIVSEFKERSIWTGMKSRGPVGAIAFGAIAVIFGFPLHLIAAAAAVGAVAGALGPTIW